MNLNFLEVHLAEVVVIFPDTVSVPVVALKIEVSEFCDVQFGAALVDGDWYKVVCVGEGEWRTAWSDRRQEYIRFTSTTMISALNAAIGRPDPVT